MEALSVHNVHNTSDWLKDFIEISLNMCEMAVSQSVSVFSMRIAET